MNKQENTYCGIHLKRKGGFMNFNIGDRVMITNSGATYSTWSAMFKRLGFKNLENNSLPKKTEAIIFGIAPHDTESKITLLAIRDENGGESLIGSKGVKLIESHYEIY